MARGTTTPAITLAELLPLVVLAPAAMIVVAGYLLDRLGVPIIALAPAIAFVTMGLLVWWVWRRRWLRVSLDRAGLAWFVVTGGLVLLYVGKASGRALLPATGSTDLVDHLTLLDYIARHQHLVHDATALQPYLQYMTTYPAGGHVLGAVIASIVHVSGFRAIQPVAAGMFTIELVTIYNIIRFLLKRNCRGPFIAMVSCALLLLPWGRFHQYWQGDYLVQSVFGHEFFYAQVIAQAFALSALLTALHWYETPSPVLLLYFALCTSADVLIWPEVTPVPFVTMATLIVICRNASLKEKVYSLLIATLPSVCVAVFYLLFYYSSNHAYLTHEGDMPTLYGNQTTLVFGILLCVGVIICLRVKAAWPALVFLCVGLVQYGFMLVLAHHGIMARYVAHKLLYLLVFAGTAIAAVGLAEIWPVARGGWRSLLHGNWSALSLFLPFALLLPGLQRLRPLPQRPYSVDLYRTGLWARDHVPPQCVDYVTQIWQAEYWLHVAVLGNRRDTARTAAILAVYAAPPEVRWHPAQPQPYLIVEAAASVPPDLTAGATELFRIGQDVVLRRPGNLACTEQPIVRP